MYEINITLTDLEAKVWHHFIADGQEWTENVVRNEIRRCIDAVYDKEASRMLADPSVTQMPASKMEIVAQAELISAKDRDQQLMTELQKQHGV